MAKPTRMFSASVGQESTGTAGPDYIEKDIDSALGMFDPNVILPNGQPGGISAENIRQVETTADLEGLTGLTIPDFRIVRNPTGDGKTPPTIYFWNGALWSAIGSTVIDYSSKFDVETGHTHNGTAGNGGPLPHDVIEDGSNSNGFYRKYADGYLECWGTDDIGSVAVGAWSITGNISFLPLRTITFPAVFVAAPAISIFKIGRDANGIWVGGQITSNTQVKYYPLNSLAVAADVVFSWKAKGRWK